MNTAVQAAPPMVTRWVGRLVGVGRPFRAPQRFLLAGVDWQRPVAAGIELRALRAAGGWTPWVPACALGHDSDRSEMPVHALVGEPIWTGPADAVQLRSAGPVDGVSLHLVPAGAVLEPAGDEPAGDGRPAGERAGDSRPAGEPAGRERATTARGLPMATPQLPAGPGQPPIIARQAWAGSLIPRAAPSYGAVRMAFVHHSVNANGYSAAEVPAVLRSIYMFHTRVRGWNDIGYNFAVDAYGRIWEARAGGIDRPVIGAQAGGYNAESCGAVLLGDFAVTLPTSAARAALARLLAWKLALHGVPVSGRVTVEVDPSDAHFTRFRPGQRVSLPRIAGHRDGCTTDCPGSDMYHQGMPPLRRAVAALARDQCALTLAAGPARGGAGSATPYRIAPGTKVRRATYLDLATVIIGAGGELPIHGFLRELSGAPRSDAEITLQSLTSTRHGDAATELARAVTDSGGLWAGLLAPRSNLLLRALHAQRPAAVSPLLVVGVRPELTLGAIAMGAEVQMSGTVFPAKRRITLEAMRAGHGHHAVKRIVVETDEGFFEATVELQPGHYSLRALSGADASNLAGASPQVFVDIY